MNAKYEVYVPDSAQNGLLSVLSVRKQGISLPPLLPETPSLPLELMPESLRPWIADAADRAQIPVEFIAAPVVVGLGSLIGRSVGIYPKQHDDWLVTPNLWGLLVGRPGVLKTPAVTEALKPLHKLASTAQEQFESNAAQHEAGRQMAKAIVDAAKDTARSAAKSGDATELAKAQADLIAANQAAGEAEAAEKRYTVNDPTVEKLAELLKENPRGLLLIRDELSGFLRNLDKQCREGDREFYLEGWNGSGGFTYDRIGRGTLHIPALCVSIFGTIQPGKLQSYIDGATQGGRGDDGLLQRFQLMVWPQPPRTWHNVDRKPDTDARDRAFEVFQRLDHLNPEQMGAEFSGDIPAIRFAPNAQEFFDYWRGDLETRLRSTEVEGCPAFEAHLSKYRSLMPSIALILHLADGDGPVTLEAAKRAADWCDFLEAHARKIYAGELNPDLRAAHLLADKIRIGSIEDGMTVRDIYRPQWSGLTEPDAVRAGFNILRQHGLAEIEDVSIEGRPREIIRIRGA